MKSLETIARKGAVLSIAALAALGLAACSAGQITQTSSQVAAVDGTSKDSEDGKIAVRDVTVHFVKKSGDAGLKFTAINQDKSRTAHKLEQLTVNGISVDLNKLDPIDRNCSVVADLSSELANITKSESGCTQYLPISFKDSGLSYGNTVPVEFVFDTGKITLDATVSAPPTESGEHTREVAPSTAHHS